MGCLATACCFAQASSPFRYDDDLSPRYILGGDPDDYISVGADLRERVESSNVSLLGFHDRNEDSYDLHRLLLFADLHVEDFRLFVQLGDELEIGRRPAAVPTDIDRGDLAQGFFDYRFRLDDASLTTRVGRFEMSFDDGALVSLRDGPNVRQSWDGLWNFYTLPSGRIDLFAVKPVAVNPGWFDDNHVAGQSLWGIHLQLAPASWRPVGINAFYYGNTMPNVLFFPLPGEEHTNTFGLRVEAQASAIDGSVGSIAQSGRFDGRDVRAWSSHADAGWTLDTLPWTPRLGVRADVLSGGNDLHGTVHTFNALYPNYAFSTEATIEAPANLIQSGVTVDLHPATVLSVQYKAEALWRYSVEDAFYAAPTFALVKPLGASGERFSGTEQQLRFAWQVDRFLNLTAAYVHFDPSTFLRSAHALGENFGMAEISVRL
jgi:hypothetical protein